jgi:hypothetical protein
MLLILFYYIACVGTTVHAIIFLATGAPPGAVNPAQFTEKQTKLV